MGFFALFCFVFAFDMKVDREVYERGKETSRKEGTKEVNGGEYDPSIHFSMKISKNTKCSLTL